jgi:hypothetical protein
MESKQLGLFDKSRQEAERGKELKRLRERVKRRCGIEINTTDKKVYKLFLE